MSAIELIEQLKALPPQEQADFERLFRQMRGQSLACGEESREPTSRSPREWPDFTARLRRLYGQQVVPGSEEVVSYGRGER